jgi:hypothetical protein
VLSLLLPIAAALVLVVYFEWRARLKSRILRDGEVATAA